MLSMLDTQETTTLLRESGFKVKEAEAVTKVLKNVQQEIVVDLVSKEYLDQKLEYHDLFFDAKLENLEHKIDHKFQVVEQRFESLEQKMEFENALLRKDMEQGNDLLRKDMKQENALLREEMRGNFKLVYWMLALVIVTTVVPALKELIQLLQSL